MSIHGQTEKVYSPETLAQHWNCNPATVRKLCAEKKLEHFRLGKLYRIKASHVSKYECLMSQSVVSAEDSVSTGPDLTANESVMVLKHAPERKRK